MFVLSIRVLIYPRFLFNCCTCASILLFHHGSIPVLFLFLTPNISMTTTAPGYTKSFSSVILPTSILFITSSTFLVAYNNLCFSIPLTCFSIPFTYSCPQCIMHLRYGHVLVRNLHIHVYYKNIAAFLLNNWHHAIF